MCLKMCWYNTLMMCVISFSYFLKIVSLRIQMLRRYFLNWQTSKILQEFWGTQSEYQASSTDVWRWRSLTILYWERSTWMCLEHGSRTTWRIYLGSLINIVWNAWWKIVHAVQLNSLSPQLCDTVWPFTPGNNKIQYGIPKEMHGLYPPYLLPLIEQVQGQ